ncbi:MAG: sulfurtransferase [Chloroflexi bacterium]|nr:sulfurtransferase [Chloroflexota bacterium]
MGALARPEVVWSTAQVAAKLGDAGVRVVDCRFAFDRDMRAAYRDGHLPGATYVSWSTDLAAPPPPSGHPQWMLASADDFAMTMSRLGISNDTMVVGYDAEGGHHAARLWLGLRRHGHDACAIMEGGIQKWVREGRPLEKGDVTVAPARFVSHPREGVVATKDDVLRAVSTGDPWLLDVRRPTEYTGEEVRSARGGHIPGAVNILWKDALNEDWTLKDPGDIEELYATAGFGPETRTITYCQAGVRAAFTHLVLTALGHPDVRTYDGSWEEWGNDPAVPVVRGRS